MCAGQDGGITLADDSLQPQMRKHKEKGKESSHRHKSSKSARFQNAWAGFADLEGGEEIDRSVQGKDFAKSPGILSAGIFPEVSLTFFSFRSHWNKGLWPRVSFSAVHVGE